MRGKKAKAIRKKIYGDLSTRVRKYFKCQSGNVIRDSLRRQYQQAKGRVACPSNFQVMGEV